MNTPYNEGRRAAQKGFTLDDNPYTKEKEASEWEEGFYSYQPKQKIRRGKREWN
jgi:hypothetical protein